MFKRVKSEAEWTLYKQNYRDMHAAGFVEAICPHGVGHHKGVHGCHMSDITPGYGCCHDCPPELWEQVTSD